MKTDWHYIKYKIPDNEEIGTLFEIELLQIHSQLLKKIYYKVIAERGNPKGKYLYDLNGGSEMPLISNWLASYSHGACLQDKWRYVTDNELMAFL